MNKSKTFNPLMMEKAKLEYQQNYNGKSNSPNQLFSPNIKLERTKSE